MEKNKIKHEIRFAEFRALDEESDNMIIEGYALTFEQPATHDYGDVKFTEVISRGALNNADLSDVPLRYNHSDEFMIMARTRNNSLQLIVDDIGLKIRAELIDTQSNRDVYKSIKSGLISKMSFAFDVEKDGDEWDEGDSGIKRRINKFRKIYDVSVVDTPFYDTTNVFARSVELLESSAVGASAVALALEKRKLKIKYETKNF